MIEDEVADDALQIRGRRKIAPERAQMLNLRAGTNEERKGRVACCLGCDGDEASGLREGNEPFGIREFFEVEFRGGQHGAWLHPELPQHARNFDEDSHALHVTYPAD
jgi:hypothetical protein